MKIDLTLTAPENCPSFDICQFNDCPLEKKPNNYRTFSEDKLLYNYHKCRCTKKKRMDIAKAYSMKSFGLTLREISSMRQSSRLKQSPISTKEKQPESLKNEVSAPTTDLQQSLEAGK